jgi:hypothetical protein
VIPKQIDGEGFGDELGNGVGDSDGLGDSTGDVGGVAGADEVGKELGGGVGRADIGFGFPHADTRSAPTRAAVAEDRFLTPRLTGS